MVQAPHTEVAQPTHHRVVVPFYAYAAVCLLVATVMVFFSSAELTGQHFQPKIIAITHLMALGWCTMIIFGASHQLIPVLIETELYSTRLAMLTFLFAAAGIPILVYGFFVFDLSVWVIIGGSLINLAIISYVINLMLSFKRKPKTDIHAMFIFTASLWLLLTTLLGLLLAINFSQQILTQDSLHFLTLHAHLGIAGWFLLLVLGVGSKLIPMFLISKYENSRLLYVTYFLINGALITFIALFFLTNGNGYAIPAALIAVALAIFGYYCIRCYKERLRKRVDKPVQLSLVSVAAMAVPMMILFLIIYFFPEAGKNNIVTLYGITIFFGWLTAIIFGMTFKTLPFIIWNKLRLADPLSRQANDPRTLYSEKHFLIMMVAYITGALALFVSVLFASAFFIRLSAACLILASLIYNKSIWLMMIRKKL